MQIENVDIMPIYTVPFSRETCTRSDRRIRGRYLPKLTWVGFGELNGKLIQGGWSPKSRRPQIPEKPLWKDPSEFQTNKQV